MSRPDGPDPAAGPPAPAEPATETAVRILAPFQTTHAGQVYGPGETVTVPAGTAAAWLQNGWATGTE